MDLITNMLNKLETIILNIDDELEYIRNNNQEYDTIENLLEALSNSKIDFAITYYESSSEMKETIRNILIKVYNDEEKASNVINEMINIYFLFHTGLLENDDLEEQKKEAIAAIEDFEEKLSEYFYNKERISETAIESRQQMKEKLVKFGVTFGNGNQNSIIDNIELIDEVVELLHLSEDEMVDLLASIITANNELMSETILEEENIMQAEIEKTKEEIKEIIESENSPSKEVNLETLDKINELLSKKGVIEKIVKIVNDDANNIVISNPNEEETEIILNSLELAREYIIDKVLYEDLSPEDALQIFYKEYEKPMENIVGKLNEILVETNEDIPYQEQIAIINKGREFYNNNKKLLRNFSKQDRIKVDGFMTSILYKSKNHRMDLYRSMSYNDDSKLMTDATYEIKDILDLLDSVDINYEGYNDIVKKVSKRIDEILDSIKTIKQEKDNNNPSKEEKEPSGRIFYLMRKDNKSMFEDDVRPDDTNKGISPEYYDALMSAIELIRNRSTSKTQFSLSAQEGDNNLRKNGVQITNTSRVKVLYIPIGKKDSIIVGVVFSNGKQLLFRDQDERLKRYQFRLSKLKYDIEHDMAENQEILSKEADERINKSLKNTKKKTDLRKMIEQENDNLENQNSTAKEKK